MFRIRPFLSVLICIAAASQTCFGQQSLTGLEQLTPFIPKDAAVYYMFRPNQALSSPLMRQVSQSIPQGFEVEYLAAAFPASAMQQFKNMRASGTPDRFPRIAFIVKFQNSVTSQQLLTAVRSNAKNEKFNDFDYKVEAWNGTEIIRCDDDRAPAAWRFAHNAFVVADLKTFVRGIKAGTSPGVHPALTMISGKGKADFAASIDLEALMSVSPMALPPGAEKTRFVTLSGNVSRGYLFHLRAEMTDEQAAREASQSIETLKMFAGMQLSSKSPEFAEKIMPIVNSIQVAQEGTSISMKLPRPANFESLIYEVMGMMAQGNFPNPASLGN